MTTEDKKDRAAENADGGLRAAQQRIALQEAKLAGMLANDPRKRLEQRVLQALAVTAAIIERNNTRLNAIYVPWAERIKR